MEYQLVKKVGNSVIRHHLTRLIRESYRLREDMFHSGWDIVIIARASAKRGWVSSDRECFDASWRSSQNNEKEDGIILKKILITLIKFYRKYLSPLKKTKCPYYPTCSTYGLEAVEKYAAFKGGAFSRMANIEM